MTRRGPKRKILCAGCKKKKESVVGCRDCTRAYWNSPRRRLKELERVKEWRDKNRERVNEAERNRRQRARDAIR